MLLALLVLQFDLRKLGARTVHCMYVYTVSIIQMYCTCAMLLYKGVCSLVILLHVVYSKVLVNV